MEGTTSGGALDVEEGPMVAERARRPAAPAMSAAAPPAAPPAAAERTGEPGSPVASLARSGEPLNEGRIVDAALEVARLDGLDQVTMRGLARDFGVTTMAIHYHVPTREALLRLVVERVLSQVEAPPAGPWEERLRAVHRRLSVTVSDYPGVGDYILEGKTTRSGVRLADLSTAILLEAGFDERTTVLAQATTQAYWVGHLKLVAGFRRRGGPVARYRLDDDQQTYPALERVAPARAALEADAYLEFGLDVIISGLGAIGGHEGHAGPPAGG